MSNVQAPARYREAFLASLEYGVNPIARADYSKAPEAPQRPVKARPDRNAPRRTSEALQAYRQRSVRRERQTRKLIVTAEDILAGRSVVA
jgi:hypothetical protein